MSNVSSSCNLGEQPKLRFPGFVGVWERVRLAEFAERIIRKNISNQTDLPLTISSKDGLVDQRSYFNKTVASKDMSGYYLLLNGEFAYNKSYSVGYDFGSIKRLDRYSMGALSSLYICFKLKRYCPDFIRTYFESLKWYKEIYMISAEGARNHGLLNVPTDDFFDTMHNITSNVAEQQKIATFLQLIDRRIEKQRALVETLKKYKRGLVEDIFNRPDNNWQTVKLRNLCSKIGSGKTPKGGASVYGNGGGIMLLRSQNILWGNLDTDDVAFISTKVDEEMRSSRVEKNDILLNITGASIGRCCHYTLMLPANVNQHVCIIRINNNLISPKFLLQQMLSYVAQKQIDNCQNGGSREGLNFQQIGNFDILVPPVSLQHQIENILFNVDLRIQGESQLLVSALKIKDGMLQQLFI